MTNIRNVKSPHWRRWLGLESRCVVPATSFCEYADTKPRKTPIWFALRRGPAAVRLRGAVDALEGRARAEERAGRGDHELFGFLTTEAERGSRAYPPEGHAGDPDDAGGDRQVAHGGPPKALGLQRPLGDTALRIVARGERSDGVAA